MRYFIACPICFLTQVEELGFCSLGSSNPEMDKLDPVDRASTEHAIYTKESQELLNQLSSGACEASWTLQERAWAAGTCVGWFLPSAFSEK